MISSIILSSIVRIHVSVQPLGGWFWNHKTYVSPCNRPRSHSNSLNIMRTCLFEDEMFQMVFIENFVQGMTSNTHRRGLSRRILHTYTSIFWTNSTEELSQHVLYRIEVQCLNVHRVTSRDPQTKDIFEISVVPSQSFSLPKTKVLSSLMV